MNPKFPAWYNAAAIEPKDEFLRKRWQGVEKFGSVANQAQALELVRLFHGMPAVDATFPRAFEAAIQKADAAFSIDGRSQEVALLAGSALTCLLERKSAISDAAALAMLTLHCRGAGSPGAVPEIVKLHRDYLTARTERSRGSGTVQLGSWAALDAEAPLGKAAVATDISAVATGLSAAIRPLVARVNDMGAVIADLRDQNQQFREESNVLWWVVGGHSRDLKRPFSQIASPSACIIAGKELADLAGTPVGPFAAPAFLDRVLRSADPAFVGPTQLSSLVSSTDVPWAQTWTAAPILLGVEQFCPLALALREFSRYGKDWQSVYSGISPVPPEAKLSGLDFACQAYEEALLLRRVGRGVGAA